MENKIAPEKEKTVEKKEEVKKEVKKEGDKDKEKDKDEIELEKFNLFKPLKPGFGRPIIIHRAILGSLERCMAILIEHFRGKWPFFLSPR